MAGNSLHHPIFMIRDVALNDYYASQAVVNQSLDEGAPNIRLG
jgi:hypothetical protein